jgi:hypothetical protein
VILAKRTIDWMDLLQLPEFNWWQFLFAALCLVVLIWSIVRFISRVHEDVDPAETDQDMLNTISELRREGDLTEDEYRSIKSQLMGRMGNAISKQQNSIPSNAVVTNQDRVPTAILSQDPINKDAHSQYLISEQAESNQSTRPVSLTEVPDSQHDTTNNCPGLLEPLAENGDESSENFKSDSI